MVHALIVRFDHNNVAIAIAAHAFWFSKIGLSHLPGKQISAARRKLLYPASHIDYIEIIVCVQGNRAWLVEFTDTYSARADNADTAEELAGGRRFVGGG